MPRGVTRKVRSLEKGGGLPHNSPPHKPKLRGLRGVHPLWRGWVGKSLRAQLYSRNVLIRGSTSTHSPGHSASYTHEVFLRASSSAHAHLHEAFVLLVTPFILNSKTSQSSSPWHAHIARVLVCVDALFLENCALAAGCHPQGSVVGERWGTPPQFPQLTFLL